MVFLIVLIGVIFFFMYIRKGCCYGKSLSILILLGFGKVMVLYGRILIILRIGVVSGVNMFIYCRKEGMSGFMVW